MKSQTTPALETLSAAYNNPEALKIRPGFEGWPVFGCLTDHVPVELIYAADILPVRLQGGNSAASASQHLQSFVCAYAKVTTHRAMSGEYNYLDGVIGAKTCNVAVSIFQLWNNEWPLKFSRLVSLPGNCDAEAVEYFKNELLEIKSALEDFRNITISDEKLSESVALYNELRNFSARLWQKKSEGTLNLTAGEVIRALKGSQSLPPEVSLGLLKTLLEESENSNRHKKGVRIMLLGNDYADSSLADLVEQAGGVIAYDATDNIGSFISSSNTLQGDPIEQISRYYLTKLGGCYRLTYEERWAHIQELISKWKIDACINLVQKYCDTAMFESPLIVESLKKVGIPCLSLEVDDLSIGMSQMKTRVEAFIETIGEI
ncbi:MAG: 2-hydroxyacyl-CoA dehydratase [Deltaproteobacteria bacterium]|nr:2-hydroxyacyl-CoA dehydratase [Deltaproteobacteria bacterium]